MPDKTVIATHVTGIAAAGTVAEPETIIPAFLDSNYFLNLTYSEWMRLIAFLYCVLLILNLLGILPIILKSIKRGFHALWRYIKTP